MKIIFIVSCLFFSLNLQARLNPHPGELSGGSNTNLNNNTIKISRCVYDGRAKVYRLSFPLKIKYPIIPLNKVKEMGCEEHGNKEAIAKAYKNLNGQQLAWNSLIDYSVYREVIDSINAECKAGCVDEYARCIDSRNCNGAQTCGSNTCVEIHDSCFYNCN